MTPIDIIYGLRMRGITQSQLSRELGYKYVSAVNNTIYRRGGLLKVQKAIAEKLNMPFEAVWPEKAKKT